VDNPTIIDQDGQEQNWDWLAANFGSVELVRPQVSAEHTAVYRLCRLLDVEGPAAQVVHVLDQDGNPLEGIRVVRHWPGAPDLPAWSPPISRWQAQGVHGLTGRGGQLGFGLGADERYSAPNGGPGSIWIADEAGPSDLISGLGMLENTEHRHLNLFYQLQEVASIPAPPVEEPIPPPQALPDNPWGVILDKLDQITKLVEEHVGE
jgi:hypothetical protein